MLLLGSCRQLILSDPLSLLFSSASNPNSLLVLPLWDFVQALNTSTHFGSEIRRTLRAPCSLEASWRITGLPKCS